MVVEQGAVAADGLGPEAVAVRIVGQLGEWRLAGCLVIGIALGLGNHLATEYWLLRIITSGENPSRGRMIRSTIARLVTLSVIAVGLTALALWILSQPMDMRGTGFLS